MRGSRVWSKRAAWLGGATLLAIEAGAATGRDATAADAGIVEVTASRFQFDPDTVEVREGDRVVLRLRSTDTVHGFALKPFKVNVTLPESGEPVEEFLADRAGVFPVTCSKYCGPGRSRMKDRLIVWPRPPAGSVRRALASAHEAVPAPDNGRIEEDETRLDPAEPDFTLINLPTNLWPLPATLECGGLRRPRRGPLRHRRWRRKRARVALRLAYVTFN